MKAIYPCSFNPIHNGHIEVIKEASEKYEHVFLLVANNETKSYPNTLIERTELVKKCVEEFGFDNVSVITQVPGTITPIIAKELGVEVIVRGVVSQQLSQWEDELADSYLNINDDLQFNYIVSKKFKIKSNDIVEMNRRFESLEDVVPKCIEKDVILKWK